MTTAQVSPAVDYAGFIQDNEEGLHHLNLAVEGMHCAGCAMKIEKALNAKEGVRARVNVTRQRLSLAWNGGRARGNMLVEEAANLGFRFSPVSEDRSAADRGAENFLLRCMAVAGFGAGNLMLFSVALWLSGPGGVSGATRTLFHWYSALIALPCVIYAGRPFFRSAWTALSSGGTNMDVPISVAVLLACAMSLFETMRGGHYIYFDSAVMLLFLLLAGRFLDQRARGRARAAAQDILALSGGVATVLEAGSVRRVPAEDLTPGMVALVARGEKVPADGTLLDAGAELDASAISGETIPHRAGAGDQLFAGMINSGDAFRLRVTRGKGDSLLADMARLMEQAEQGSSAYKRLADRIAGWYTPVVHLLALATFFIWWGLLRQSWQPALMTAVTVLVITCPCALGLAVPVVQVLTGRWLFSRGMLLKSGDALERLNRIDTVVFDKTGTLTTGRPALENAASLASEDLALAAALAAHSRHPLCRAIAAAGPRRLPEVTQVQEEPGGGMSGYSGDQLLLLGSRAFCGLSGTVEGEERETWFRRNGSAPARLVFRDKPRQDAAKTIAHLKSARLRVILLSGDRRDIAKSVGRELGIEEVHAPLDPKEKLGMVAQLEADGFRVLMVGDGINDAPSLVKAHVSMSPSSGMHIAQNAADIVFQGDGLMPVAAAVAAARFSQKLTRQNLAAALIYNIIAVPLAMAGFITPLIAALAMSASSLAVTANSMRMNRFKGE